MRNDLLLAVGWYAAGTVFYLTGMQKVIDRVRFDGPLWHWLVVLAVGCVAIVLRRPVPLAALGLAVLAVIIDWFNGPSLPVVPVLSVVLYGVARHGSPRLSRVVLAGAVVITAAITVGSAALDGDWRVGLPVILQAGVILLVPVWWAMEVREYRERAEIARREAAAQARIAELERRDCGRAGPDGS